MLIVTRGIGPLLASVLRAILVTLMSHVDQNAQLTASVLQQNPAKITNATTLVRVCVGPTLNAKSSITFQTVCVSEDMLEILSQAVAKRKYVCVILKDISHLFSIHIFSNCTCCC